MQVQAINSMNVCRTVRRTNKSVSSRSNVSPTAQTTQPAFRGKFGAILGGALGFAATIGACMVAPPAAVAFLSCMTGAGALGGAYVGDIAEDKINKNDESK